MPRSTSRDTQIEILQRTNVREGKFRTDRPAYVRLATVFAEVEQLRASSRIVEGMDIALRPCRVCIAWRAGLTAEMRLRIDGEEYRIISGPTELGRRRHLEMTAQRLSTEGARP